MNLIERLKAAIGYLAIAAGLILAGAGIGQCVGCGGTHMTAQDSLRVGGEWEEERACIYSNLDGGRPAIDVCRAAVHAKWDAYWTAYFADGGAK